MLTLTYFAVYVWDIHQAHSFVGAAGMRTSSMHLALVILQLMLCHISSASETMLPPHRNDDANALKSLRETRTQT